MWYQSQSQDKKKYNLCLSVAYCIRTGLKAGSCYKRIAAIVN